MSKYGVISGPYFPVFSPTNTGKYGQEITPYLETFHAVLRLWKSLRKRPNFLTFAFLTNTFLWVKLVSYHPIILRSIPTIDYLQLLFYKMILTTRRNFQRSFKYWFGSIKLEKKGTLFVSTKKVINKSWKTTVQENMGKSLKYYFSMNCLTFRLKVTLFCHLSLVFNLGTLVLMNY